jgi:hypothetical protein
MPFRYFSPRDPRFHPSKQDLKRPFPERVLPLAIFLQLLLRVPELACNNKKKPYNPS